MAKVVCVSHNTRTQRGLCRLLHAGLGGPCANRVFPQLGCDSTDNKSSSPSFAQLPSSTGGNGWANFAAVAPVESSLMMVGFLATHHQARECFSRFQGMSKHFTLASASCQTWSSRRRQKGRVGGRQSRPSAGSAARSCWPDARSWCSAGPRSCAPSTASRP